MNPIEALFTFFALLLTILVWLLIAGFLLPLPISDTGTVRYRTLPYMTIALVLINILIYVAWQAPDLYPIETAAYYRKIYTYGFRPTSLQDGYGVGAFTTFSAMFMHADLSHLIGNMFFLWTFGRRVEDACGPWRYLIFYLFAGMVANLGSSLLNPAGADIPGIGASGAIAGLMGAYLILFPAANITCIWGVGLFLRLPIALVQTAMGREDVRVWRWFVQLPAWSLLIYYGIRDLLPSLEVIANGNSGGGVNNLAHLMGYVAAATIIFFVRKDLLMRMIAGRSV